MEHVHPKISQAGAEIGFLIGKNSVLIEPIGAETRFLLALRQA
jgi:hypothetical protein